MGVRMRMGMRVRLHGFRGRRGHEGIGERTGTGNGQPRGDQATDETSTVDSPSQVTLYEFLIRHDVTPGDFGSGAAQSTLNGAACAERTIVFLNVSTDSPRP
jgi:hypothetical protein